MSLRRAHALVAVEARKDKRNGATAPSEGMQDARRALAEEKLKAFIERVVAEAPELGTEARCRLASILQVKP